MSDQKYDRNQEIYNKYMQGNTSYNKLAREYNLTPQRIQVIVSDFRNQKTKDNLKPNDPQEKREEYKNLAIEVRESARYKKAISMFKEVLAWDVANKNHTGYVDVLGHTKIAYVKLAENSKNKKDQEYYYTKATESLDEAVKTIKEYDLGEGRMAIMKVHKTGIMIKLANSQSKTKKEKTLKLALKTINSAIKSLPGSEAHKAWAMIKKAQILHLMGNSQDALNVAHDAETNLFLGYDQELDVKYNQKTGRKVIGGDQGIIKLRVWLSMIFITIAQIYKDTQKYVLAQYYVESVLSINDPEKVLKSIKQDAKKLQKEIDNSY